MIKVLLVDDDKELCAMQADYLAADGFDVTCAHDGEAGVAAALGGAPGSEFAIVVLDVMMPKLNGIDALRRIREQSDVPVIMLTARGDDIDRVLGLEFGADDYVPKPCTPRELVARIRAILRRTDVRITAQRRLVGDRTRPAQTLAATAPGQLARCRARPDQHRVQRA